MTAANPKNSSEESSKISRLCVTNEPSRATNAAASTAVHFACLSQIMVCKMNKLRERINRNVCFLKAKAHTQTRKKYESYMKTSKTQQQSTKNSSSGSGSSSSSSNDDDKTNKQTNKQQPSPRKPWALERSRIKPALIAAQYTAHCLPRNLAFWTERVIGKVKADVSLKAGEKKK